MTESKLKEFLSLPPDQIAIEAAKVLTDKPWKHDLVCSGKSHFHYHCVLCGESFLMKDIDPVSEEYYYAPGHKAVKLTYGDCSVPDPIELDMGNAVNLFRLTASYMTAEQRRPHLVKLWQVVHDSEHVPPDPELDAWIAYCAGEMTLMAFVMAVKGAFKENDSAES